MSEPSYYAPTGGLPDQTQLLTDRAMFTDAYAVIPKGTPSIHLRLSVEGKYIQGYYRQAGTKMWQKAGECDLPANGKPKVSLQAYQGPKNVERWATITEFRIRHVKATE